MSEVEDPVAAAYLGACLAELDAPKPGNVHRFAPGHGMTLADFVRSAEASAGPIASRGARSGYGFVTPSLRAFRRPARTQISV